MSWEEMRIENHKCPCGNGIYTVTHLMDDWNRSDETWKMNCNTCKNEYTLFQYSIFDSGMHVSQAGWIKKSLYDKVKEIEKELHAYEEQVVQIFTDRYQNKWLQYFEGLKSKKQIWGILNTNKLSAGSLSTFYSDIKIHGIRKHLLSYLKFKNLQSISQILEVSDNDILSRINECKALEKKYKKSCQDMRKGLFS